MLSYMPTREYGVEQRWHKCRLPPNWEPLYCLSEKKRSWATVKRMERNGQQGTIQPLSAAVTSADSVDFAERAKVLLAETPRRDEWSDPVNAELWPITRLRVAGADAPRDCRFGMELQLDSSSECSLTSDEELPPWRPKCAAFESTAGVHATPAAVAGGCGRGGAGGGERGGGKRPHGSGP